MYKGEMSLAVLSIKIDFKKNVWRLLKKRTTAQIKSLRVTVTASHAGEEEVAAQRLQIQFSQSRVDEGTGLLSEPPVSPAVG